MEKDWVLAELVAPWNCGCQWCIGTRDALLNHNPTQSVGLSKK